MASTTTAQKLKIRAHAKLLVLNPPADYKKSLGILPDGARITTGRPYDQIHWFVKDRKQMEKELKEITSLISDDVICWIFYPKGTSRIQTDLTRDKGWDELMKMEMQWISLISFDDTWSAFGMRQKTESDIKRESRPKERPIFDFVDPLTKTVTLPDDFAAALKKHSKQEAFFHGLSFTNRKEYIEWIVTAKREETRKTRVKESIERLAKEWKNPANR